MIDDHKLTITQKMAIDRLFCAGEEGAVVKSVTADALIRRGFAERRSPRLVFRLHLTQQGMKWCEERADA